MYARLDVFCLFKARTQELYVVPTTTAAVPVFFFLYFFFLHMFLANHGTSGSFFIIFSSVAPHRGQPSAKCHPRWQPTRGLAVSCGLGRHWIWTLDCRTTVWCATIEPPRLPLSHHASLMYQYLGGRVARWPRFIGIRKKQPAQKATHPRLFTSNSFLSTTCYILTCSCRPQN